MDSNNSSRETKEQVQDYKTLEAEVIGELRKDKIGKPGLVFKIFGLLLIVLIILPFVTNSLNDENSKIYKFIHKNEVNKVVDNPNKVEFLDGSKSQVLLPATTMKYETVIIKNITLNGNTIKFITYSYNGLVNLDTKDYYLEISSNTNQALSYIKLSGTLDFQEREVEYTIPNFNANNTLNYYGKIYEIKDNNYPAVNLNKTPEGLSTLTCKKNTKTLIYSFKNDYLINLRENFIMSKTMDNETEFDNQVTNYTKKKTLLNNYASFINTGNNITFNANINLETPGYMLPDDLGDYDYYPLDTQVKEISYKQIGKGYDCK